MNLQVRMTRDNVQPPAYASDGAAAFDLQAAVFLNHEDPKPRVTLAPGEQVMVGTGIQVALPIDYALDILPRSGAGAKRGLVLGNGLGLIDADYRGEIIVCLWNRSQHHQDVQISERIAQARLVYSPQADIELVNELPETLRGAGGFGSTGV